MKTPKGIRNEARAILEKHPENIQMMYTRSTCDICGAHLTIRQLNRVIIEGVPPVCLKDYKGLKEKIQNLSHMMGQLSLF